MKQDHPSNDLKKSQRALLGYLTPDEPWHHQIERQTQLPSAESLAIPIKACHTSESEPALYERR